jgi:hypothetical protein
VSVGADQGVSAGRVLSAAYEIGRRLASGAGVERRSLADLPLGDAPLWVLREVTATADTCTALLPAWSRGALSGKCPTRMMGEAGVCG